MAHDPADPPRISDRLRRGEHARLLHWQRHPDGWWAHIAWIDTVDSWTSSVDHLFERHELRAAKDVQPVDGEDYTKVPRVRLTPC